MYSGLSQKQQICRTLLNLGITQYKSGNLPESLKTLQKSHKIGEKGNWTHRMVFTNIAIANVLRMQRDFTEARQRLHTAYTQAQELGYPREEALALEFLGDVYRDEHQFHQARRFYGRAMAIGQTIAPKGDIVMEIHRRNGECLMAEGELGQAVESLNKCIIMAQNQGDRFEEAVALRVLSEIKKEAGNLVSAEELVAESVEILDEIGARFELALSLHSFAELKIRQVDRGDNHLPGKLLLTQAWNHATKALDHALFTGAKPLIQELRQTVDRISSLRNGSADGVKPTQTIVHQSPLMRDLLQLTDMFANTDEPVLISGETGTGKELIAKRLHMNSQRAEGKLVSVNVTAIPATMFEREMFGHVRGSFSGADRDGLGFIAEAEGGTLFLDEIGDLPLEAQPKLLRLLQEGSYQALGDPSERQSDIRVVAATNANLEDKVRLGEFRSDLYFRLKVLELDLPPLRERAGDVALLLRNFLSEGAGRQVELGSYFDPDSVDFLERHTWPGNIRELMVLARRALVEMKTRGWVRIPVKQEDGSVFIVQSDGEKQPPLELQAAGGSDQPVSYNSANERSRIMMALDQCGGNRMEAAEKLGMGRSTLYRRMKKLGL